MTGFCPFCEKDTEGIRIQRVEELNIKGEAIAVEVDVYRCLECGQEFDNPDSKYDPLVLAYREYRRRKGMVQPEQIRSFREQYELTQRELNDLLGFGGATISRYENGALQDDAHDMVLRLALDVQNFIQIVERKETVLGEERKKRILQHLKTDLHQNELLTCYQRTSGPASIYNGYRVLDIQKVICLVKVFVSGAKVYKTKLNKLLFYVDFKYFKDHAVSITGLSYAHLPYGPVPDNYELLYQVILEHDSTLHLEEDVSLDTMAEYFVCEGQSEQGVLSLEELETALKVKKYFYNFTSKKITYFSHEEKGYQETKNGDMISYDFSKSLRL